MTVPMGQLRNDRPYELIDERWESSELKLLIAATISDSRMGDVEYRLTSIRRGEPPAHLFVVPSDYTIDRTPTPHDQLIALMHPDRYPAVGEALGQSLLPPR
jgi:hypothetical protein